MKKILNLLVISLVFLSCDSENAPDSYKLNIVVEPSNAGTAEPIDGEFTEGEEIVIEAKPIENGSNFVRWEGDWSSNSNPIKLTMNKNYNLIKEFPDGSASG